jgi:hypothetical protein
MARLQDKVIVITGSSPVLRPRDRQSVCRRQREDCGCGRTGPVRYGPSPGDTAYAPDLHVTGCDGTEHHSPSSLPAAAGKDVVLRDARGSLWTTCSLSCARSLSGGPGRSSCRQRRGFGGGDCVLRRCTRGDRGDGRPRGVRAELAAILVDDAGEMVTTVAVRSSRVSASRTRLWPAVVGMPSTMAHR